MILSIALYGCETWSLRKREKIRLKIFENKILRRIFGHKSDDNQECRRPHNEEFHVYTVHLI